MTRFSMAASLVALCAAAPAAADVTAAELWAEWQSQATTTGRTVTADEVIETDTGLILRGFTTTYSDDLTRSVGRAEEIVFEENSDGSVTIRMAETYDIEVTVSDGPGNAPAQIGMQLTHDGLLIVADGTVEARSYAYTADRLSLTGADLSGGGSAPPEVDFSADMAGLSATYVVDGSNADLLDIESSGTLASLVVAASVLAPPGETGQGKFSLIMDDMSSQSSGTVGSFADLPTPEDPSAALPDWFNIDTSLEYGRIRMEVDIADGSDRIDIAYANESGEFDLDMSTERIAYSFATDMASVSIQGTDLPVPIDAAASRTEFNIDLPLAQSAEPQTFEGRLAYLDVTMGDPIWALFDAGQSIPRDPVTAVLDVTGTAQVLVDLLTADVDDFDAPPMEVRSLTVNDMRLSVGGADLSGVGDVTFAPGQAIPQPVGTVDLALSGGLGLLDRLQASGLVPLEQIAMVRGVIGAFTRPGPTPDTLETTIEFAPGGGITANGLPLQ